MIPPIQAPTNRKHRITKAQGAVSNSKMPIGSHFHRQNRNVDLQSAIAQEKEQWEADEGALTDEGA